MIAASLIIPNRNNSRFLRQCLDSALEQTRPFAEIIVVDDGSTDDSIALIREYEGRHAGVRLVRSPVSRGVSQARNVGVGVATAPYVTFLDADDFFWNPTKNEHELGVIEAHLPAQDVVAFSDVRLVSACGDDLGLVSGQRKVREGRIFRDLLFLSCLIPRDFTYPRHLHALVGGFDERLNLYEDWDFKLRLARRVQFRYTGSVGVAYRSNPAGQSRVPLDRHYLALRAVARRNTAHFPWAERLWVRSLAQVGVLRFLRGAIWTWLKQQTLT